MQDTDVSVALDVLASTCLSLLYERITVGDFDGARDGLAYAVDLLSVATRAGHDSAHENQAHAPAVFYERVRTGRCGSRYFLEGVPHSLQIFSGVSLASFASGRALSDDGSVPLPPHRHRSVLMLDGVKVSARTQLISTLETPLSRNDTLEVHGGAPVECFVRAVRWHAMHCFFSGIGDGWSQCANSHCGRICCADAGHDELRSPMLASHADGTYWLHCGAEVHSEGLQFCCSACWREWWHERVRHEQEPLMHLLDGDALERTRAPRRSASANRAHALRNAIYRNKRIARILDALARDRTRRGGGARGQQRAREAHARIVRAANIDVGVIYAAMQVAKLATFRQRYAHTLPGSTREWRYADGGRIQEGLRRAVHRMEKIYDRYRCTQLVSDLASESRYMRAVRHGAIDVFASGD